MGVCVLVGFFVGVCEGKVVFVALFVGVSEGCGELVRLGSAVFVDVGNGIEGYSSVGGEKTVSVVIVLSVCIVQANREMGIIIVNKMIRFLFIISFIHGFFLISLRCLVGLNANLAGFAEGAGSSGWPN